ncbi:MAG: YdcF family protein, partial [Gammaproteobacteria bacterium]
LSPLSLERVRYAAWLVKRTGLPLITSGGRVHNEEQTEAELMRDVLQKEFLVIVDYIEGSSRTTYENAKYTAQLLKEKDMDKIALVTHAWHMPRARGAFEEFDIEVIPAPTGFYGRSTKTNSERFMPSYKALWYSGLAFHELLGSLWYSMRYY